MSKNLDRRSFLKKSLAASAGAAAMGLSSQEKTLLAKESETATSAKWETGTAGMPMGRIGDVQISRLFLGGNQFWGGAHSRDLAYIRPLLQRYYADEEKIHDALEVCEENGINTICHYENGIDGLCGTFLSSYWKKRGGKMQYLAWVHCPWDEMLAGTDLIESTQRAIDDGAVAVYIRGCEADRWVQHNKMELIEKFLSHAKKNGVLAGVGAHDKEVVIACEREGIDADFYFKTIHHDNYWGALPKEKRRPFLVDSGDEDDQDSIWEQYPEKLIEFMNTVEKPWIGFKTLAAGAIQPKDGFRYAFQNGADFICAGMLDFQIKEDAIIAKRVLAMDEVKNRPRPWRA
jgi:hypothetical protein